MKDTAAVQAEQPQTAHLDWLDNPNKRYEVIAYTAKGHRLSYGSHDTIAQARAALNRFKATTDQPGYVHPYLGTQRVFYSINDTIGVSDDEALDILGAA